MSETTTPTPALPITSGSPILAAVYGSSRRKRLWEMHDDGMWWDTFGNCREGHKLRDVEILRVAASLEGDAA